MWCYRHDFAQINQSCEHTGATLMPSSVTYRQITYRLLPEKRSTWRRLDVMLDAQRHLYNAALEERIDCYRKTGRSLTYFDQAKSLTVCREDPAGHGRDTGGHPARDAQAPRPCLQGLLPAGKPGWGRVPPVPGAPALQQPFRRLRREGRGATVCGSRASAG